MRQYNEYLPDVLREILEFKELGKTTDERFAMLDQESKCVLNNSFISSLDDYGCCRWEKMLHLAKRDTDSIEDRRLRILTKFLNQLPYTEKRLREMLDSICGVGEYTLEVDIELDCVRVRIALSRKNQIHEVNKMLEDVVPLNLWLDVDLLYNQHDYLANYAHRHLRKYTHKQLKEEQLGVQEVYQKHIDLKQYSHSKLHEYSYIGVGEGEMLNG